MTIPQSQKKIDGGRIKGPANVRNVVEIQGFIALPNTKMSTFKVYGAYTTAPTTLPAIAQALFTSISSAWGTNLAQYMHTQTSFQKVGVRDMASYLNPISIGTGTAVAGSSASPAMPSGAAIVMTENIASRGKGLKGRNYLGGWATNADAGAGLINSAVQTAINAFGTAVFNAITAQNLQPCVAQVARQQYVGITGTTHAARIDGHVNVTTYTCSDLLWDAQRRRGQP